MTANNTLQPLTIFGSSFQSGYWVQYRYGAGSWTNFSGAPTINSSGQITVSLNPGGTTDTIYIRVCDSSAAASCSSNTPSVAVTPLTPQTITFTNPGPRTLGTAPFAMSASGGQSGNPVTFTSQTTTVCTVSGSTVTLLATGTCTIAADQAGNATYAAASQVTQGFLVTAAIKPSCTLTATPASIYSGATSVLAPSCVPSASSYLWTGGTCASTTIAACTVTPTSTTTYTVAGVNAAGTGATASATVTVIPNLTLSAGVSGIGQSAVTLNATSSAAATGSWMVVPRNATAPTSAQVKSAVNYSGVIVVASGYGSMSANLARSFNVSGLAAGTDYDFYVAAMSSTGSLSPPVKVQATTTSAASAPVVAKFEFAQIANQQASALVPVSIRAVDASGNTLTGFNEIATLTGLNGAKITPSALKFANGLAQGAIEYRISNGVARLSVQYANGATVGGVSNTFELKSPGIAPLFTVKGVTQPGASVYLTENKLNGSLIPAVIADASGSYQLKDVHAGYWTLHAEKPGYKQVCPPRPFEVFNDCMVHITDNLTVNAELRKPGRPVIIVPGMMGSTLNAAGQAWFDANVPRKVADHLLSGAPQMPKEKCSVGVPCELRNKLEIYDPQISKKITVPTRWGTVSVTDTPKAHCVQDSCTVMGVRILIDTLLEAGFEVFTAPWDWRQSFKEAAEIYLKPRIEEALNATGATKVDIVAHSMGGLVTRSYIEQLGPYLRDNIEHFIMLGTPNNGATNAYFLMEGGDPLEIDRLTSWLSSGVLGPAIDAVTRVVVQAAPYTAAANELWRSEYGVDMVTLSKDSSVQYGSSYVSGVSKKGIRELFLRNAPGGLDLLPTYDMVKKWSPSLLHTNATDFANGSLQKNPGLNENLFAMNRDFDFASQYGSKIKVNMFLSDSEQTLNLIGSTSTGADSTYRYGKPDDNGPDLWRTANGDGTVLRDQAPGPFARVFADNLSVLTIPKESSHIGLPAIARCDVVKALQSDRPGMPTVAECVKSSSTSKFLSTSAAQVVVPAPLLVSSIDVDGQYSGLLTAPDGKRTGTVAGASGIYEEISGSGVSVTPYQLHIAQVSPSNAIYQLKLTGDSLLVNTAMRISLNYMQAETGSQNDSVRILSKLTPYLANIVQNSEGPRWMSLVDPVSPPTALKATPKSDMTYLSWAASTDATATGYRVYYRPKDDDRFMLLGETVGTAFTTTIPWALNYESANEFVVLARNASGVESPIRSGNSVRNMSYARASFSSPQVNTSGVVSQGGYPLAVSFVDQSESTAPLQTWAWDFNGDGVIDGTSRNPTFTYQLPGNYTVSLTTTAADGSTDTVTIQNFVNVLTVPAAPTIDAATAGSSQARISFTVPVNDGGTAITSYTASCSATGQSTSTAVGTASPLLVASMSNGVSYTCSVTATNSVGTGPSSAGVVVTPSALIASPTYRFNNLITGGHFLSSNESERAYVLANLPAYHYEGVGFYTFATQVADSLPVYRFSNSKGFHYFTISEAEKSQLLANAAYQYDGAAFYAYATEVVGSTPVYRFQNSISGSSFYTSTTSEYNYVLANYPAYVYQNIVFYVRTGP
jgi:PKD repeat protein